jgi:hypothetical protein
MTVKIVVLWVVTLCSPVEDYGRFSLLMEVTASAETSENFYKSAWRHIRADESASLRRQTVEKVTHKTFNVVEYLIFFFRSGWFMIDLNLSTPCTTYLTSK